MKTADNDVGKYLSMFTLFDNAEIQDILNQHQVKKSTKSLYKYELLYNN